ncbi:MAG TPA: LLM class flavin-dependent oxidoreductase [Chloroflexota bacterium]
MELGLLLHTGRLVGDDAVQPDLGPFFEQAHKAEELGFDHVWCGDSSRMERGWGRADCISLLAALAVATRRVRIGVIPLTAPLRHPVLLAHQLATVDVLSGGRLLVSPGSGKGGPEGLREFANCSVPYGERGARLSEMLQIMKLLWTQPGVTYRGRFWQLEDATVFPKPLNRPIPLLVATGRDPRALRRVGRYGDGWFMTTSDSEAFKDDLAVVRAAARDAGRDPAEISRIGLFATFHLDRHGDKARADAPRLLEAYFGSHGRGESSPFFGSPKEIGDRLSAYAAAGLGIIVARVIDPDVGRQFELLKEAARG